MSEFHDPFPNYEVLAQHDEAHGKTARKKLWVVFWILLIVTVIEVVVGLYASSHPEVLSPLFLKCFFIGFTIVKAFYIVYKFMHLGHEERWTKWMIIAPFTGFILYFIFMLTIGEGNYSYTRRLDSPTEQAAPAPAEHK
ncbi:MAG: cytochrome C oxidase subunit IV family protein [Bacteroidota bacterium]|nr:cytochrome C oxidase subunit IV family protein [Bacteroidota bacterium]